MHEPILSHSDVSKLVDAMTASGQAPLTELQVERFLNALTRTITHTPTGVNPEETTQS